LATLHKGCQQARIESITSPGRINASLRMRNTNLVQPPLFDHHNRSIATGDHDEWIFRTEHHRI
jgi:hypothetical protein